MALTTTEEMMMTQFKVGDRVRWTLDTDSWQNVTLTGFSMGSWDGTDPEYGNGAFYEYNLELIAPQPTPTPITERMRALIERMAIDDIGVHDAFNEAGAIMAELDPDALRATKLMAEFGCVEGEDNYARTKELVIAAIKLGRSQD